MTGSRRELLTRLLFGAGLLGLRSLATGVPAAILADPRRGFAAALDPVAQAACAGRTPRYLLLSASVNGDPLNANVPGMYDLPDIAHPPDPAMAPTPLTLGGRSFTAAAPWAALPQAALDRTCFFHHGTYTVVHPDLVKVMTLQGFIARHEMLASFLAAQLAPCLGTVQVEPVALGPRSASEALTVGGRPQPILSPTALASLLAAPGGPLGQVQTLRDQGLDQLNAWCRRNGNAAQRDFLDRYAASQQQARSLSQSLLGALAGLKDNSPASQATAAVLLFRMNVAPVISVHLPFGGDNHVDPRLAAETAQTLTGVAAIGTLHQQLIAQGMQDQVVFATLNVFGRTLSAARGAGNGRNHHGDHHCAVLVGQPFKAGVVGGVEAANNDYRAQSLDSASGAGVPGNGGDVPFAETLSALGKTLAQACGVDPAVVGQQISGGKVIAGALA